MEPIAKDILDFWFGPLEDDQASSEKRSQWFKKDPKFDRMIAQKFEQYLDIAFMGALDRWTLEPHSHTALIVLLDQFPRNIFRNSYKAFHFDKKALALSMLAIEREDYLKLSPVLGYFMLMPTMHAENLEVQELGIKSFEKLLEKSPDKHKALIEAAIVYAKKHRDIIARFGRFPHRNAVLERESSSQEEDFLKEPGSSF